MNQTGTNISLQSSNTGKSIPLQSFTAGNISIQSSSGNIILDNNISLLNSSGKKIPLLSSSGNTTSLKLVNTSSLQQPTNSVASSTPIVLTKFKSGISGNPGVILSSGNQSSVITSSR